MAKMNSSVLEDFVSWVTNDVTESPIVLVAMTRRTVLLQQPVCPFFFF